MTKTIYPYQDHTLKSLKGEKWKPIPGLEYYYVVSNFGRVKRLEYEMQYSNGAIYLKEEKIIKPRIIIGRNQFKNDYTYFLTTRVTLNGIRYNFMLSRLVYYCFVSRFDLSDKGIVVLCQDSDGFNIRPGNLKLASLSEKGRRIVEKGRRESPYKNLSKKLKAKQRKAIVARLSKQVSQYSMEGKLLKTYSSAAEAQRKTGVYATSIGDRASGRGISAGGFVWRWGNQKSVDIVTLKKERRTLHRAKYGQKVSQYDMEGNKIAQYNSLQDAQIATGANSNAIRLVITGEYKSAKGWYWRKGFGKDKIDLSGYKWGRESMAISQFKKVRQLSLKGKLMRIYPSIKQAARETGASASDIIAVCKCRQKTTIGYRWEYVLWSP